VCDGSARCGHGSGFGAAAREREGPPEVLALRATLGGTDDAPRAGEHEARLREAREGSAGAEYLEPGERAHAPATGGDRGASDGAHADARPEAAPFETAATDRLCRGVHCTAREGAGDDQYRQNDEECEPAIGIARHRRATLHVGV